MDKQNLHYWVALKQVPGVGNRAYKQLMDRFETPENVFSAPRSALTAVEGVSGKIAGAIASAKISENVKNEIRLAEQNGYRIVTRNSGQYPPLLHEIYDPPPYLYALGGPITQKPAIAIVGTRHATRYGLSMARRVSADLAQMGFAVVSGMAAGIDTAAHQGALSAGGQTVAVLGSGLSVIYPPENRKLYQAIAESGTVVSEKPVEEGPNPYNFPARNRIISGMTLGTVVVEAARKSGALITAKLAAEQNREVFAVPGNINSFKSIGTHSLLKQGAKLVEKAEDVAEEFAHLMAPVGAAAEQSSTQNSISGLTTEEVRVYECLDAYPVHFDLLARQSGMEVAALSAALLNLELKGIICQMPGKYFCKSGE
ncbi:MAG: DNA-processing protein DprA [Thermodesulfobacteriota bacterium]